MASAAVGACQALAAQPATVADVGMEAPGRHVPCRTTPPAATPPPSRDQALVVWVLRALRVFSPVGVDPEQDR